MDKRESIQTYCSKNNIQINDHQIAQLIHYSELLLEINSHMNLVSRSTFDELLNVHIHDSMQVLHLKTLSFHPQEIWVDIGSGGGFPGIIAAILFPQLRFFLVESIRKKYSFLLFASTQINLPNVSVYHGRAEEFVEQTSIRNQCTFFSARGVGTIEYLAPMFEKSSKSNAHLLLWKKPEEVSPFLATHARWQIRESIYYPSKDYQKCILCMEKIPSRKRKKCS